MSPGVVGKKQISSQKSQLPQSEGAGERGKKETISEKRCVGYSWRVGCRLGKVGRRGDVSGDVMTGVAR